MLLCLWRYRRRRRALQYEHPNLSDFVIVDNEGQPRFAGEGVPRTTGEEEDSFLRRSGDATDGMQQADTSARLVTIPSRSGTIVSTGTTPLPEGVVPTALKSISSKGSPTLPHGAASPFFHASASSLFFNPSRGPDQAVVGAAVVAGGKRDSASTRHSSASASPVIGNIIPTRQLLQMEGDWKQEDATAAPIAAHRGTTELGERLDEYGETPLRPPPVLNPDGPAPTRPISLFGTVGSNPESPGSDLDEAVTLLTARRVMMNEGGPTTLVEVGNSNGSGPSSWGSSLAHGLGGLTRLSRLSWFQRMEAIRTQSPASEPGRTQSRSATPSTSRRPTSLAERAGLTVPRPISHLSVGSGKSSTGDTVFYDALSSVSTRSGHGHSHGHRPSSMPPVPRPQTTTPTLPVSTPNTPPAHDASSGSQVHFDHPAPPSPVHPSPSRSRQPSPPNAATVAPVPVPEDVLDVLDTPVPTRVSPFSTASSRGGPVFPPGLEQHISNVRAWRESSSDMPSPASFGTGSGRGGSFAVVGAGPDILEEEPPRPGEGWTHLRAVTSGTVDTGRRTTLGQVSPSISSIVYSIVNVFFSPFLLISTTKTSTHVAVPNKVPYIRCPIDSAPTARPLLAQTHAHPHGTLITARRRTVLAHRVRRATSHLVKAADRAHSSRTRTRSLQMDEDVPDVKLVSLSRLRRLDPRRTAGRDYLRSVGRGVRSRAPR